MDHYLEIKEIILLNSFVFAILLCQAAQPHCAVGLFAGTGHQETVQATSFNHSNAVTDHARQRFAVKQPDHSTRKIPPQGTGCSPRMSLQKPGAFHDATPTSAEAI